MIEEPPTWLVIAEKEMGVAEIPGKKSNKRIIEYQKSIPSQITYDDEIPWCSAFVNFVFAQDGIDGTDNPLARSWLHWGLELNKPRFGCVVILKRGKPWQGHVGFYVGKTKAGTIRLLGGNQSNKVSIINVLKSSVLGYRWPKEAT